MHPFQQRRLFTFTDQWLSPKGIGFSSHFMSSRLAKVASLILWCNALQSRIWAIWGEVVLRYIALTEGESCFAENRGW